MGYPAGAVDGIFGAQTYRAVVLFQHDHDLSGDPGVWQPAYDAVLASAEPMLPARKEITHQDLDEAGDPPVKRLNLLQRIFAWLFGTSALAQAFGGSSVMESIDGVRNVFEPIQDLFYWASANRWLFVAAGCGPDRACSHHAPRACERLSQFRLSGRAPRPSNPNTTGDCTMSALFGFLASLWGRLLASAFLGPIAPILTGIGQLIGGVITAFAEIVAALAKSPEGRVALCLVAAGLGFFFLRYHYIEEGRAIGRTQVRPKIVTVQKPCAASVMDRRKK